MIRVVAITVPLSAVAVATVLAVGSCNRHDERAFTVSDAARVATVRPAADGWTWPKTREQPAPPAATDESGTDALVARFRRQTADLAELGERNTTWRDGDKLGHLTVGVYGTASDAHQAFAPFNTLS